MGDAHPDAAAIHALVDHEVPPAERLRLARHLRDCPACLDLLDRIEALSVQLSHLPAAEEPAGLTDRVMSRVRSMTPPGAMTARLRLAAPLLLLVLGGMGAIASAGTGRLFSGVSRLLRLDVLRPESVYELVLTFATAALGGLGRAFDGLLLRAPEVPAFHLPAAIAPEFLYVALAYFGLVSMVTAAFAGRGLLRLRSTKP
jgi:hypothetical protein